MKTLKKLSVENVAAAIEADAGQALPGLREALAEAKAGQAGRVHTPEQIVARRRGRPGAPLRRSPLENRRAPKPSRISNRSAAPTAMPLLKSPIAMTISTLMG